MTTKTHDPALLARVEKALRDTYALALTEALADPDTRAAARNDAYWQMRAAEVVTPKPRELSAIAAEHAQRSVKSGDSALIAVRPRADGEADAVVTLALGAGLDALTRAGAILARLLATPGAGPWYVVAVRPSRRPTSAREIDAAERILAGSNLVDAGVAAVLLVTPRGTFPLASTEDAAAAEDAAG